MEKNNFLRFLILWVTLSEGFAFSLDNRTADSSHQLLRKRRVVDRTPNANTQTRLRDTYYVVNIQRNGNHICPGIILAAQIILTTLQCVQEHATYTVVSGTLSTIRGGTTHRVTGILRHPPDNPEIFNHDVALLSINPPITFGSNKNRPISLFHSNSGQLPPNTLVTVSGYGITYNNPNHRGGTGCIGAGRAPPQRIVEPNELRTIRLPTIRLQDCRNQVHDAPYMTNEIICTHHELISCSPGEHGNPLVFNDHLVGIQIWDGFTRPFDLYLSVAWPERRNWILSHMSPEHIPRYVPPPPRPIQHRHTNPQDCSRVHPCSDYEN